MSLQTIDTQIGLTTVRAAVLYPQARLKTQGIGYARTGSRLKHFRREHIDDRRRFLSFGRVAVGGDDHTVELLRELTNSRLELNRLVLHHRHRQFQRLVAHKTEHDGLFADRHVFEEIVSRLVGHGADVGALDLHVHKRQVFACLLVQDVSRQVRIILCQHRNTTHSAQ